MNKPTDGVVGLPTNLKTKAEEDPRFHAVDSTLAFTLPAPFKIESMG